MGNQIIRRSSIRRSALALTAISVTASLFFNGFNELLLRIFDFINKGKYPPSLLYVLMTMGPAPIFLSFAKQEQKTVSERITVFDKLPFFYYILEVFLIHSLTWMAFFITVHSWNDLEFGFRPPNVSLPPGGGYPLWVTYVT